MSNSAAWGFTRPWLDRTPEPQTRAINMNLLGRVLTEAPDPPVNLLFVYNCNPAATMPDQTRVLKGLAREDLFTVVFEQVMTDTALLADVVLPATTFLEGYDFSRAYGPISLQLSQARDRPGGRSALQRRRLRRPWQPPRALGRRRAPVGARHAAHDSERVAARVRLAVTRHAASPRRRGRARPCSLWTSSRARPIKKCTCALPRSTRKRRLAFMAIRPDPGSTQFPLALISPASERTISSTLGELPRPEVKLAATSRRCGGERDCGK